MKLSKLKVGTVYEVSWNDAYGTSMWRMPEQAMKDMAEKINTVGYYVGKNKAGDLLFASSYALDGGAVGGVVGRPPKMITKVKRLT